MIEGFFLFDSNFLMYFFRFKKDKRIIKKRESAELDSLFQKNANFAVKINCNPL
jgi:hypothetical protein